MRTGPGRLLRCPHCGFDPQFGVGVCQGCGAEVVYGPTAKENSDARVGGFLLGFCLAWLFGPTAWWGYLILATAGWLAGQMFTGHLRRKVRFFRYYKRNYNRAY